MNEIAILIAVSAIAGLAIALFRVWFGSLVISGFIVAIVGAIVLQNLNFGFAWGIAIIVCCISVHQLGYLIGAFIVFVVEVPESSLPSDQPNEHPGEDSYKDITGEHKEEQKFPPRPLPPND